MRVSFIVIVACLAASMAQGAEVGRVTDSLCYSDEAAKQAAWSATMGDEFHQFFSIDLAGVRLTDIPGDTYQEQNSQKAVFLRKPHFDENYYFQVKVSRFIPKTRYAQAGLVVWQDEDNYVRNTVGFDSPAMEGLGEFNGKAQSRGLFLFYPRKHPLTVLLKVEVLRRSIRTYASLDNGTSWLATGGFTLSKGMKTKDFIKGIGIMGVNGEMKQEPLFSDWEEGRLLPYADNDFSGAAFDDNWMTGQTNSGWGSDKAEIFPENGSLVIKAFPGSDIFLRNENYPFAAIQSPARKNWDIEIKINMFDPLSPGHWNKGGIVVWQDNAHFLNISLVSDPVNDRMYFEALGQGDKKHFFGSVRDKGLSSRTEKEAWFRIRKINNDTYKIRTSYDGKTWINFGTYKIDLPEPQIRLFASGDIFVQHQSNFNHQVSFDYIQKIKE